MRLLMLLITMLLVLDSTAKRKQLKNKCIDSASTDKCKYWARRNDCNGMPLKMIKQCRKTCGFCECQDYVFPTPVCEEKKLEGFCHLKNIAIACRKTCSNCELDDNFGTEEVKSQSSELITEPTTTTTTAATTTKSTTLRKTTTPIVTTAILTTTTTTTATDEKQLESKAKKTKKGKNKRKRKEKATTKAPTAITDTTTAKPTTTTPIILIATTTATTTGKQPATKTKKLKKRKNKRKNTQKATKKEPTTTTATTTTTPKLVCGDKASTTLCETSKEKLRCRVEPFDMMDHCRKTCGFCECRNYLYKTSTCVKKKIKGLCKNKIIARACWKTCSNCQHELRNPKSIANNEIDIATFENDVIRATVKTEVSLTDANVATKPKSVTSETITTTKKPNKPKTTTKKPTTTTKPNTKIRPTTTKIITTTTVKPATTTSTITEKPTTTTTTIKPTTTTPKTTTTTHKPTTTTTTPKTTTTTPKIRTTKPTTTTTTTKRTTATRIAKLIKHKLYSCGQPVIENPKRIITGDEVTIGSMPWQASIRRNGIKIHICGGALINSDWVLSTAHCVEWSYSPEDFGVYLGKHFKKFANPSDTHQVWKDVAQIIMHENFDSEMLYNNIALIKLATPVEFNDHIIPICLPPVGLKLIPGQTLYVTGWGDTQKSVSYDHVLRMALVPYINTNICENWLGKIAPTEICAGREGRDSCQGDIGGPLIKISAGKSELVGLVSWGTGCALQNKPAVFTRVSEYLSWIYSTMRKARISNISIRRPGVRFDEPSSDKVPDAPNSENVMNRRGQTWR